MHPEQPIAQLHLKKIIARSARNKEGKRGIGLN